MQPTTTLLRLAHPRVRCVAALSLAATGLLGGASAQATDRAIELRGGWFFPQFNTDLRVDSNLGVGTNINLEDDLGLESSAHTWFAGLQWRFFARHRLAVEYWKSERSSTHTLNKSITVEDENYAAGATISTTFNLEMVPVSYSYSFIKTDRHELAASIGVHWSRLEFGLAGNLNTAVGGVAQDDGNASVSTSPDLPLPLIGADYGFKINDDWKLSTRAGYFSMNINDIDGSLIAAGIETEYWFSKHVAAGAGVDYFRLDVSANVDDFRGDAQYSYIGPKAFLKVGF